MDLLRCSARRAKTGGMLGDPVTIAAGAILSEYYGKDIKDYDAIMHSRSKTARTASSAAWPPRESAPPPRCPGRPPPKARRRCRRPDRPDDRRHPPHRVGAALALPCRGSVPQPSREARPPAPALSYAGRQEGAHQEDHQGARGAAGAGGDAEAVVMYTVHGKDGGLAHGLATILPRKGYAGSDPVEAYVVFAANMDKGAGLSRIAMLPEEH